MCRKLQGKEGETPMSKIREMVPLYRDIACNRVTDFELYTRQEKEAKRRKMHQRSPNQKTEAVSDRALLRKLAQKGKLLITQPPAGLENCKKVMIKTNWKHKAKERAEEIQGLTKFNLDYY